MDMNQYGGAGVPYPGFPMGAVPLALVNEPSLQGYENLTETEKEHLILQCKDAKTSDVVERIMDSSETDLDAKGLAEEEAAHNSYR